MMEIKKGKCKHCGDIFTLPESGKDGLRHLRCYQKK